MDRKETVILRRGQVEALLSLTSLKDVKTILSAIKSYGMDGVEPEIPEHLMFGWVGIKYSIDYDNEQYNGMVEKRKSAAAKRWDMQKHANDASACKSMQTMQKHANDALIHIDNDIIESEYIRACASDAERIASLYPKAKVGNFRQLVEAIINAISRELDHPGITPEQAVGKVESGTIAYAAAVKKWKHKKFISDAVKFYDSGMYNHDPATWEPDESNKKQKEQNDDSSYEYVSKLR